MYYTYESKIKMDNKLSELGLSIEVVENNLIDYKYKLYDLSDEIKNEILKFNPLLDIDEKGFIVWKVNSDVIDRCKYQTIQKIDAVFNVLGYNYSKDCIEHFEKIKNKMEIFNFDLKQLQDRLLIMYCFGKQFEKGIDIFDFMFSNNFLEIMNNEYRFSFEISVKMMSNNDNLVIPLNREFFENAIKYLNSKIEINKIHNSGVRNVPEQLRREVLERDNYTCCKCGNSIYDEPNLLLEIDHIIPWAKGGKTEFENLQTLCWRCNRSKSDKI